MDNIAIRFHDSLRTVPLAGPHCAKADGLAECATPHMIEHRAPAAGAKSGSAGTDHATWTANSSAGHATDADGVGARQLAQIDRFIALFGELDHVRGRTFGEAVGAQVREGKIEKFRREAIALCPLVLGEVSEAMEGMRETLRCAHVEPGLLGNLS